MKKALLKIASCALAVCLIPAALLSSCTPSYEKYHTKENIMDSAKVEKSKLTAYYFLLEDGSAVMDICNESKNRLQRLEFPQESKYYASLDFDFSFAQGLFQDMNFDGELDLYVPCSVTTENLQGMAWLWDSDKGEFVLSEELSALYELLVDEEAEIIMSQDYSSPDGILCKEFKWEDGILVQVGEYTINY